MQPTGLPAPVKMSGACQHEIWTLNNDYDEEEDDYDIHTCLHHILVKNVNR